jgi:ribosomal protein L16/L10AE
MGKVKVQYWAAVGKPEELCLKLEGSFVSCKEALRLAAQSFQLKLVRSC